MRTLKISLDAGVIQTFEYGGGFLEVLQASEDITIILRRNNGVEGERLEDVREGIFISEVYSGFTVQSATSQEVRLLIGGTNGGNRAAPLTGTVSITGTVPVSGPLTDAQLRAVAVPVSGPLTSAQLTAATVHGARHVERLARASKTFAVSQPVVSTVANRAGGFLIWNAIGSGIKVVIRSALLKGDQSALTAFFGKYRFTAAVVGAKTFSVGGPDVQGVVDFKVYANMPYADVPAMLSGEGLTGAVFVATTSANLPAAGGVARCEACEAGLVELEPGQAFYGYGLSTAVQNLVAEFSWTEE